jgi:5-methylcytosine-specific restriction endonuclease McrA
MTCLQITKSIRRQEEKDRRRARQHKAFVRNVNRKEIFKRDHWICGICGQPVDSILRHPHPGSATLDHIIPLAKGGTHEPSNTQLAHFMCNSLKSDR